MSSIDSAPTHLDAPQKPVDHGSSQALSHEANSLHAPATSAKAPEAGGEQAALDKGLGHGTSSIYDGAGSNPAAKGAGAEPITEAQMNTINNGLADTASIYGRNGGRGAGSPSSGEPGVSAPARDGGGQPPGSSSGGELAANAHGTGGGHAYGTDGGTQPPSSSSGGELAANAHGTGGGHAYGADGGGHAHGSDGGSQPPPYSSNGDYAATAHSSDGSGLGAAITPGSGYSGQGDGQPGVSSLDGGPGSGPGSSQHFDGYPSNAPGSPGGYESSAGSPSAPAYDSGLQPGGGGGGHNIGDQSNVSAAAASAGGDRPQAGTSLDATGGINSAPAYDASGAISGNNPGDGSGAISANSDNLNSTGGSDRGASDAATSSKPESPNKEAASKILDKAAAAEPAVTSDMQALANANGGQMAGLEHRLKTQDSLERKLDSGVPADNISDALRYTMTYPPENLTSGANSTMDQLTSQGYQQEKVANTFANENSSYKGLNTSWSKDGQTFELQFHTPQSLDVKENQNHDIYEVSRQLFHEDPSNPGAKVLNSTAENSALLSGPESTKLEKYPQLADIGRQLAQYQGDEAGGQALSQQLADAIDDQQFANSSKIQTPDNISSIKNYRRPYETADGGTF